MNRVLLLILSFSLAHSGPILFDDVMNNLAMKNAAADYYTSIDCEKYFYKDSCELQKDISLALPSLSYFIKNHFNNPLDVDKQSIERYLQSDVFAKEQMIFFDIETKVRRARNSIHEAGHLLLYMGIAELKQPYSQKIKDSLYAKVYNDDNLRTPAQTFTYEPSIYMTDDEIKLRMLMLLAGQVSEMYIFGSRDNYLSLESNNKNEDLYKWLYLSKRFSGKNIHAMLDEQEDEVQSIIETNRDELLCYARVLFDRGEISNKSILNCRAR